MTPAELNEVARFWTEVCPDSREAQVIVGLQAALREAEARVAQCAEAFEAIRRAALALDAFAARADCALPDCPHDGTGCARCLAAENEALLSALREARAQLAALTAERDEKHRLAVESRAKMDEAYAHADAIQSEMTTATDDCPHPTDTWTTCSACHLKVMRERDALTKQVADLEHADKCHAKFYARLCDALHIPEPHAVDGDVFDAIADLEARAIPAHWIGTTLEIRSFTGKAITDVVYVHPGRTDVKRIGPEGTTAKQFATLSDALRAAALESSDA